MGRFKVQMNYNASIVFEINAVDEGAALDKARDMAEDADIRQFVICNENDAKILYRE